MIKQPKNIFSHWKKYLQNKLPVKSFQIIRNEIILVAVPEKINFIIAFLRYHINSRFEIIACISGTDYPEKKERFEVAYELLSLQYNSRVRIKTYLNEKMSVESVCSIFSSANWWEREIWDLFGIFFFNHPDLRRILTDYGFQGFPLRKDFPLFGFVEVRYDEKKNELSVNP